MEIQPSKIGMYPVRNVKHELEHEQIGMESSPSGIQLNGSGSSKIAFVAGKIPNLDIHQFKSSISTTA